MSESLEPRWLSWAREIQALAQTGLNYCANDYDEERYHRLTAIAAEIVQQYGSVPMSALHMAYGSQLGYATPKIDVRGAVIKDGKLLLVRERSDGGWTMPGGWADVGNVPSQAAEREVWEEAGFRVKASKLVGVYDANRVGPVELFHAFKIIFLCEIISGEPTPSNETTEVAFFGPHEIPDNLSGERTKQRFIKDAFAAYNDPSLPAVFD